MARALRFLRLLLPEVARRWREVLAAVWAVWAAISIITGGGPVADMPYTVIWLAVGLIGWLVVMRYAPPPPRSRRQRFSRPPVGDPPPYRILLGWGHSGWISAPPQVAALVLGPPRSGKTRGVIIPNVAAWPGPVLVTSTRRDVLDATVGWRGRQGIPWIFDPLGVVDPLPAGSYGLFWSPLRGCRDWDTARRRAEALAVDAGRGVENASHWRTRATQLVAVGLHAAACGERNMATLCSWVHAQRSGPLETLTEAPAAKAVLEGLLRTPDREQGSIWSAAQGILSPFDTESVCRAADSKPVLPFDPYDFLIATHTVYVVSPSDAPTDGAPLVVGLVEEVREAARQLSDQEGGALSNPWLCALDEAATICPLPALPRMLAEGGGRNIATLVAMQDLRQAQDRWGGDTAHSFLTLAGAKVVLPGLADAETLRTLEELAGREFIPQVTTTETRGHHSGRSGSDRSQSTSHGWVEQPRVPASAWRSGPHGSAWALVGQYAPAQIQLVDPSLTEPFREWLQP
ncbi:MAG: type IV secretory system conjugative DNA transfer family protein [Candidatus Dormibacteraeota bacterium]|jgi:type IV secretory pathway TraG/TraD family ATPase VirD4|nr:type IV secretory system conjugative DNA transfer family protein [Candidatus Dormibacteraeota bacterium]